MLRFTPMTNAEGAKDYYTGALARADYYVSGSEIVGTWQGIGASYLGLFGAPVDQRTFAALVDNHDPRDPEQRLTLRTKSNRRPGYDLTFDVPKGLSLLAALTGDSRIHAAFQQAVTETMSELEQAMQVRVRTGAGADEDRHTGNIVYGEFMHFTARPVGGSAPDPHLHMHCCIMNASFDPVGGAWKAGQFGAINRDINYYEAAFHSRLARAITELGYKIKRQSKSWDLADLPDSLVRKFQKRTDEIEEIAHKRGITDPKAKDRLGAETRTAKRRGLTSKELKQAWWSQLTEAEAAAIHATRLRATAPSTARRVRSVKSHARASVDYALDHLFERTSVASDKQIAETALRHAIGQDVGVDEIWHELARRTAAGQLFRRQVKDQQLYTTREAYDEATRCIDYTRDGMGHCRALAPEWVINRDELLVPTAADQRAAIQHVLSSTDRVIAVQGRAGAGKTFASQEIAAALAAAGHHLQALAPTSQAVDVLRKDGFANAETVSQLLVNPQLQQFIAGGVLLVDEAGLLSTRQLDRLFRITGAQNCRVLLQYDLAQHRSVERGSPVRDLERYAGLQAAEINVIRRQTRKDYAAAVNDLRLRNIDKAFTRLERMDAFVEIADPEERQQRLTQDYLAAIRKPKSKVLVVSPTHREGDAVTKAIRTALRRVRRLKTDEHETLALQRSGLTTAQRGESASYVPGQVIQFNQNVAGHQRGDRLVVKERLSDGTVLLQQSAPSGLGAGAAVTLCLADKESFEVYEPRRIGLSAGDRIRITQNGYVPVLTEDGVDQNRGKDQSQRDGTKPKNSRAKKKPARHRLTNNATFEIIRFTKGGDMLLNNGWVLPRNYGHLTYGYCTTSHASQGITADTVLISQSAESFGASSREQFYVSCSRGRTGIKIYTDSVAELSRAVARSDQQLSAADLVTGFSALQQSSHPLPSAPSRKGRANRIRQARRTAAAGSNRDSKDLRIEVENGVSVIASRKRSLLQVGTERGQQVITTLDRSRYIDSIIEQEHWVCGPRDPPESAPLHIPGEHKTLMSDTDHINTATSVSPATQLPVVAPTRSQPEDHSQSPSI